VEETDPRNFFHQIGLVAVMRNCGMPVSEADFGVLAGTALAVVNQGASSWLVASAMWMRFSISQIEVLIDLAAVGWSDIAYQRARSAIHKIEYTAAVLIQGQPNRRIGTRVQGSVHALENQAGIDLGRHGSGGPAPRHAVHGGAALAGIATVDGACNFAAEFHSG
jgi:hypothetical protein